MSTNVQPSQLNYDNYSDEKYDQDIVNSIPFHKEIHKLIAEYVQENFDQNDSYKIVDLGVGTGITALWLLDLLPNASMDVVDFSEQMMEGAKRKLGDKARYLVGDYLEMEFDQNYDIVVSVIGMHHQNHEGKQEMFKKIYGMLNDGGVFIFGDLMTYRDAERAHRADEQHYAHLREYATDEKTLAEWEHHHRELNDMAPIEDQVEWLEAVGFKVEKAFHQMNTGLLFANK